MRAGKGIEEENKGFFCSATTFALKEEKIAAQLFRDEPLSYSRPIQKTGDQKQSFNFSQTN
jgi:hypothetical protein